MPVSTANGVGLQRGEVGAAGRLGHRDAGLDLAGAHAGQPALLLLLGAQVDEVWRHDVAVDAQRRGDRRVDPAQLFGEHRVEPVVVGAAAAVLLGDLQPEQALASGLQPHVPVDHPLLDELLDVRRDRALDERLRRLPERGVILVEQRPLHDYLHTKRLLSAKRPLSVQYDPSPVNTRGAAR
jgi:hypothetical protein